MAPRMANHQVWRNYERALKNAEVAEQGKLACIELASGLLVADVEATGLLPIGRFIRGLTGDGAAKAQVRLFREIEVYPFINDDNPNHVALSDIGNVCFIKDGQTVSMSDASGTRSVAGRIWWVEGNTVFIEPAMAMGLTGPEGPPGA